MATPPPPPQGQYTDTEKQNEAATTEPLVSLKDTVTTNEEDDEVDTDDHPRRGRAAVGHNAVIHHGVPVFPCQDLRGQNRRQPARSWTAAPDGPPEPPGGRPNLVWAAFHCPVCAPQIHQLPRRVFETLFSIT